MGGGKSFYSVIRMSKHIADGGIVFSNIDFKLDPWFNESYAHLMKTFWMTECFEGCRMELHKSGLVLPVMRRRKDGTPEFEYNSRGLKHYLRTELKWNFQPGQYHYIKDEDVNADLPSLLPKGSQSRPVLVILDEALDHFEANGGNKNATAEFRSFLRHIRKLGINLIFIAQDFGSLEPKIRALTHFVWKFRDMYSWPVPVINRPLPPPWRDHVICEKYHRAHFGKSKAEAINRDTWVFRDPLVFGCYQSIATHNAKIKMADDMKTDFGDEGKVTKGKRKMNFLERAALFLCLIFSIVGFFSKGDVRQSAGAAQPDPSKQTESVYRDGGKVVVLYGKFRYADVPGNNFFHLSVDGIEYKPGQMTASGTVLSATADHIHIRDNLGNDTFIYPLHDAYEAVGEKSKRAATQEQG